MDPRSTLFSRRQLAELTGLDNSTLNYWMREEILRPLEGGNGRGQHRRFAYHQVNLAALLNQLREFGVGLKALRSLADKFHDALNYMAVIGVDRSNWEPLNMLMATRHIMRDGFYPHRVYPKARAAFEQYVPGAAELEHFDEWAWNGSFEVRLNWEQAVAHMRAAPVIHHRDREPNEQYTDELVALASSLDLAAYREADLYWSSVTQVITQKPDEDFSTSPEFYYRRPDGSWALEADVGKAARQATSFIGVDFERLSYAIWSRLQ